jgi:hypothetical protein
MTDSAEHYVRQVPRDQSGRLELLATHPPLWEFLLFGNVLYVSRAAYEPRWRDYQLGYSLKVRPVVEPEQVPDMIAERMTYASAIISNLEFILAPAAQTRALGILGTPEMRFSSSTWRCGSSTSTDRYWGGPRKPERCEFPIGRND